MKRQKHILIMAMGAILIVGGAMQLRSSAADDTPAILAIEASTYGGCSYDCYPSDDPFCEAPVQEAGVCAGTYYCQYIYVGACSREDGLHCEMTIYPDLECEEFTDPCFGHRDVVYCCVDVEDPNHCIILYGLPIECPGGVQLCGY